jgi:hypothetical protein
MGYGGPRGGMGFGGPRPGGWGYGGRTVIINNGPGPGGPPPRRSGGSFIATLIIVVWIIIIACSMVRCSYTDSGVTASTVEREALPSSAVKETAYYTDEDGGWISSTSRLESGLKSFYKETGVQPYVYILPNGTTTSTTELTKKAEELYDQLFTDEGHFLLVFCDDDNGGYNCGYVAGSEAQSVMDSEALEILQSYLNRYYEEADTDEEVFSDAFAKTADRIMTVTKSPWPSVLKLLILAAAITIIVIVLYKWWKKRKEQKNLEAKQTEEILKTPLEKYEDQGLKDLEKKYEQKE